MEVAARPAAGGGANALYRNASRAEPALRFDDLLGQRQQTESASSGPAEASSRMPKSDKSHDAKAASRADRKHADRAEDEEPVDEAADSSNTKAEPSVDETTTVEIKDVPAESGVAVDPDAPEQEDGVEVAETSVLQQAVAADLGQARSTVGNVVDADGEAQAAGASMMEEGAQAASGIPSAAPATPVEQDAGGEEAGTARSGGSDGPALGAGLKPKESADDEQADADLAETLRFDAAQKPAESVVTAAGKSDASVEPLQVAPQPTQAKVEAPAVAQQQPVVQATPEERFAEDNHDTIVKSIRGELGKGGSVQLRLDPPSLGKINVQVTIDDAGVMSASMQTTNDEATRLLSHSLHQLKTSLEAAGVSVDRIQVKQAPQSESAQSQQQSQDDADRQQRGYEEQSARQEQQRKEMLQRMWRKLGMGYDDLDLVA